MNIRLFSIAAVLLFSSNTFAQTMTNDQLQARAKELLKQDASQYVNEETYALPAERIMEKDILWAKTVWRNIDAHDAVNQAFNTGKPLVNILIEGALSGKIKLYDAVDDRFTKELSKEEIVALMAPGKGKAAIKPSSITQYRIKEQWLFTNQNKMVVRIVGLAPVTEAGTPLCWTFFPNDREYLAQVNTTTGKNWDALLTNRDFKSTIDKVKGDMRAQKMEKE